MAHSSSDQRLEQDITAQLNEAPRIEAQSISVKVSGAVAHLSGTVLHPGIKRAVLELVTAVPGVERIEDNLQTEHDAQPRDDEEIGYRGQSTVSDPKANEKGNLIGLDRPS